MFLEMCFRTRLFENLRMLPHAPGVQMSGWCLSSLLIKISDNNFGILLLNVISYKLINIS